MSKHPINLAIRFILEITSLLLGGIWGFQQSQTLFRYFLAFAIPILLVAIWGTFAVPNDPSRSGKTIVKTPGVIRLLLELLFFGFATWVAYDMGYDKLCLIFGVMVLGHYLFSMDRVKWLFSQR